MAEQWIVRVQGKEYGPVDLEELREWRQEGRLIRENEIREPGSEQWIPAGELPELFADETAAPASPPAFVRQSTLGQLLGRTWQIYRERFAQFLGLSALVIIPSICAQLSSAAVAAGGELDLRTALAGLFNFCMIAASFIAWPIYVAGLQILTSEAAHERSIALRELIPRALKYWSRVAILCVLVYGAFFLLLVLAFAILVMVAAGPPNLLVILVALALLVFQVWMFGRLFINVLFWQQFAVLGGEDVVGALRKSKALARGRPDLVWYQRPLWRGVFISSLWFAFVLALDIPMIWPSLQIYFHGLITAQDPQAMVQAVAASSKAHGSNMSSVALGLVQTTLRPLLGIAFVLLYFDAKSSNVDEGGGDGRPSEL